MNEIQALWMKWNTSEVYYEWNEIQVFFNYYYFLILLRNNIKK